MKTSAKIIITIMLIAKMATLVALPLPFAGNSNSGYAFLEESDSAASYKSALISSTCTPTFSYSLNCRVANFENTSNYQDAYWNISNDTTKYYSTNFSYEFPAVATYSVCLIATDTFGFVCGIICESILVDCNDSLSVPPAISVITPNDDGKDDVTLLSCFTGGVEEMIDIFNRDGRLVRRLVGSGIWDGKDGTGTIVPMGFYIAINKQTNQTTHITVIR
ncbi:MAG: gliding motility-associated C-terminal domain-containing protein [Bacteroidetes bacterium]|nr:gliding motility-associated C-terminal domain-containing protein [Bacteroidota bacterium]